MVEERSSNLWAVLFIVQVGTALGQIDSSKLAFYPLHIGDTWQYNNGPSLIKIIGDTLINGIHYYAKANPDFPQYAGFVRVDSLHRVLIRNQADTTDYNRAYRLGESPPTSYKIPEDVAGLVCSNPRFLMRFSLLIEDAYGPELDAMVFNPFAIDTIQGDTCNYGFQFILVRGLGVYREEYEADQYMQLTGAVINGVQWGTIVSVEENSKRNVDAVRLEQNYPNPFNARTTMRIAVSQKASASLDLYDILGRHVRNVLDLELDPGVYSVSLDLRDLTSGVYFCQLFAGGYVHTRKLILLR